MFNNLSEDERLRVGMQIAVEFLEQLNPKISAIEQYNTKEAIHEIGAVMQSHLFLDSAMNKLISAGIPNMPMLFLEDMHFDKKLRLLKELDFGRSVTDYLDCANSIRRTVAHRLKSQQRIEKSQIEKLGRLFEDLVIEGTEFRKLLDRILSNQTFAVRYHSYNLFVHDLLILIAKIYGPTVRAKLAAEINQGADASRVELQERFDKIRDQLKDGKIGFKATLAAADLEKVKEIIPKLKEESE